MVDCGNFGKDRGPDQVGRGRFTTRYYRSQTMLETELLAQLGSAVRIAGGVRAVASKAELDPSNVSKFLRTARGLGSDSVRRLETALGRPGGQVGRDHVVRIHADRMDDNLARALSWYLPEGAVMARASWTGLVTENLKKLLSFRFLPEIYGFKDELGCRLVLSLPSGLILPEDFATTDTSRLKWFGDDRQHAVLDLDDGAEQWLRGEVTPAIFDMAWPTRDHIKTAEDLLEHVNRLDITWSEAIRRVSYNG